MQSKRIPCGTGTAPAPIPAFAGLVLRAFTPRAGSRRWPPEIDALAHDLIDTLPGAEFDLLEAFRTTAARHRSSPGFWACQNQMTADLLRWSNAMVGMYQAGRSRAMEDAAAVAATENSGAFLRDYIDARRARPADDLITHLIAAEEDGQTAIYRGNDRHLRSAVERRARGDSAQSGVGRETLLEHGLWPAPITDALVEECLRYDPGATSCSPAGRMTTIDVMGVTISARTRNLPACWVLRTAAHGQWDPARSI